MIACVPLRPLHARRGSSQGLHVGHRAHPANQHQGMQKSCQCLGKMHLSPADQREYHRHTHASNVDKPLYLTHPRPARLQVGLQGWCNYPENLAIFWQLEDFGLSWFRTCAGLLAGRQRSVAPS